MPTLEQRINSTLEALGFSPTTQVLPVGTVTHTHQADGTEALVTCVDASMGATAIANVAHLLQRDVDSTNIELITILAMPGAEDWAIELEDARHWSVPIDIHVLEAEATGRTHLNLEEGPAGTERLAQSSLSDQFIGKETHEIIDLLGEQLIDLSRRNPLLNFTLRKDTIRLIQETPNGLFEVLANKNKSMQLEPDWDLEDEPTKRRGRGSRSGTGSVTASSPSKAGRDHTLDESSDGCAEHYDTDMQTAMSPNMLMRTAGKVFTEARRLINNTGTNQLYLAIGFLSWFEKPESDIESRAPLLLIPLVIEREKSIVSVPILPDDPDWKPDGGQNQTRRVEQFRYALTYTGDELRINVALRLRLADEFNLVLPDTIQNVVDGEMSPEAYLEQVAKMAASYTGDKRWRVRREACIGFFDFAQAWMYEDITSEAWKRTPCEGIDTIFSGGQGGRTGLPSLTRQQMEDSEAAYEIPLICPADTSQYQVITQALGNHSLVVEGPPGTGKSQTITNIISALMAQKKRVLFLAAKETALTVVAKRLEDAGLGDLLLTMHADGKSGGTSALEVVNSITQRMHHYDRIAPKLKPQPEIKRLEDRATHARKNLNALVEQLARVDAVTGESLSTLIWKANGALDAYERAAAEAEHPAVVLPTGDAVQRLGFNEATLESEDFVLYLRNLEIDGVLNPVPEWRGIKAAHLAPEQISRLTDAAESFQTHMASVEEGGPPCLEWSNTTPEQLLTWYDTLATIAPNPMPQIGSDLPLEAEFDTVHGSITDFSKALSEYHEAFASLDMPADRLPSETDLTQALEGRSKLVENSPAWRDSGNQTELDDLRRQLESLNRNCAAMNEPDGALAAFPSDFIDVPTITNMSDWLTILQLLDGDEALSWGQLTAAMGKQATSDLIDNLQYQVADIQQRRESLTKEVDFDCYDGSDAAGLKGSLRQDGFWAKHWPWSERNDARRKCRRFLRIPKPTATDCIRIIDQMTTLPKDESAIRDHHEARSFLGELYQGEDTKWEPAITACTVTRKLVDLFGMLRLDELLARPAPCSTTELIATGLTTVRDLKEVVDTHIQMHDYGFERMNRMPWKAVLPALEKAAQDISGIIAWYDAIPWEPWRALPFGRIGQTLMTAKRAAALDAAIPVHSSRRYLGTVFQGTGTNTEQIAAVCTNLDTIAHCRDGAPASAHAAVLAHFAAGNWDDAFATLKSWQENTGTDITALRRVAADLEDLHATTAGDPFHIESYAETLPAWQHHISARCANADGLLTWHELSNRIIKAESLGYKPLIDPLLNAEIPVSLLTKAFEASSRKAYIDAFAAANGIDLNELRESKVSLRREAFRNADAQRLAVSTEMVVREHLGVEAPDEGPSGSRIRDKRGMQLVKSAIGKKRTSVTVRDLTDRAGATLKAFKPVWLMSPGSTSQYLPQAPGQFDVLIVDEASQLRTAEIAGAALRSKRMLIFGDTKQMPPSNQMRRSASNSNEDYELGESLLERAAMSMPSVRLEWHYRSQHEDLIAYSNRAFYDDSLVVFPSPTPEAPDLGVAYEFVGGHFIAKINQAEAQRAADLMCAYLAEQTAKAPDVRHTVGVVAMNGNQRDLIAELVDRKRTNDQRIHQALIASEDAEEPFFITNLENVQGDERDHIIISCTYGPETDGMPVRNNFGPITNVGGERRLNVLFTRARRRMTVLSSMHPGDIRTTGGGNPHLRDFLAFAGDPERRLPARGHKGEGPENIFEETVGRILEEAGYTVDYQVGCKGYRIDMAVHDQDLPGSYLLAIECDGATYHSSMTARERDRMRQEILEYAGWRFHRVWSTDWFLERSKTSIKLLDALAEAQEEARNERALRQAAQEADAKERVKHAAAQAAREEKAAHLAEADADFTDDPLLTATDTAQNGDDESDHCEVYAPDTTLIPNMAPYRRWVGTAGGSVDEPDVTPSTIAAALVRIVTIEGPMLCKVAFDRYRAGSSMGRLTARRLGFMEAGLAYATKHLGLVCDEAEDDDNGVVRMQNQPEVHLRAGGDRQICDIPNAETKAFVSQFIAARKGQSSESECLDAVLRWLHMTRRGARIVKAVQEALNERS